MTIPHLMNCSHSGDGWCLECMRPVFQELEELRSFINKLHKTKDGEYVFSVTSNATNFGELYKPKDDECVFPETTIFYDIGLIPVKECFVSEEKALEELEKTKKGTQND